MHIRRATLDNCHEETDTVVVIDVLRAFTTAAYAFAAGASEIILAGSVEEAFRLKKQVPESLTMGEVDGYPVEGFDLSNSPSALVGRDLSGRQIIHRSTAGTQGVLGCKNALNILAASLCCASVTVNHIRLLSPRSLTLVETGVFPGGWGDEDQACADYIEGMLINKPPDRDAIIQRVRDSRSGLHYSDPLNTIFPPRDLVMAVDIDRFDFAMKVERKDGLLVMAPVK